jgi:hypothetical protein
MLTLRYRSRRELSSMDSIFASKIGLHACHIIAQSSFSLLILKAFMHSEIMSYLP